MKMAQKLMSVVLALTVGLGFAATGMAAGHEYGKQKVAYHVNYYDAKRQTGALRNIQNHINAVGAENLDLRVVMHGNGVSLLLEPDQVENTKMKAGNADENMTARISNLKDQGVTFKICANTLKGRKIDLEYLFDASEQDIVPSGVAEIAHLQAEGFAYLRP
tara:strand:- start:101 stop:586 length:486 start_codon:yes stop_codon:yes gene_type:complete